MFSDAMHWAGGITTNNSFETTRSRETTLELGVEATTLQGCARDRAADLFGETSADFEHFARVAGLAADHGGSDEQVAAAWLHDTVEDKGGAPVLIKIRKDYGDTVAAIVDACSDSWVVNRKDKEEWFPRKVRYINHIASAPPEYVIVCAADKLDNVERCRTDYANKGDKLFARFKPGSGRDGQLWYYRRVTEELVKRGVDTGGLLERLESSLAAWLDEVKANNDRVDLEAEFDGWCEKERKTLPTVGEAPGRN